MGIFSGLVAPIGAYGPIDDFWYSSISTPSASGIRVTAHTAMKTSAVWACVRLISETMASIPLIVYRRRPDGGRERATNYYLYHVLHDQANRWQTALEFREMMTAHVLLRGNAYAEIVPGRRGFADQLIPLHPDYMRVEKMAGGSIRYVYRSGGGVEGSYAGGDVFSGGGSIFPQGGSEHIYTDEEIFHLRGLSSDGLTGMSVLQHARDSIGLALATEDYGARLFSQDARPGGVLEHPGHLTKDAQERIVRSWEEKHAGLANAHRMTVLEEGMKWVQVGMSNDDSQFLQTREFQISDIARWFRVPLHMIGETSKVTSWGSGIEQLSLAFVIYTLLPWARRWEAAISRDLIVSTDLYYAEHLFDSLLRGDAVTRAQALQIRFQNGTLSPDEWRQIENMDPLPDGQGEAYYVMANLAPIGSPPPAPPAPSDGANAHYWLLLREVAARIVRREIAALSKAAKRCAADPVAWTAAIEEIYADHAAYVAESLQIGRDAAAGYVSAQRADVLSHGAATVEGWGVERVSALMALAGGATCPT